MITLDENSKVDDELMFLDELGKLTATAPRLSKLFTSKFMIWVYEQIGKDLDPDLQSAYEKKSSDFDIVSESEFTAQKNLANEKKTSVSLSASLQTAKDNLAVAEKHGADLLDQLTTTTQAKTGLEIQQDTLYLLNNNLKTELAGKDIDIQRLNKTIEELRNGNGDQFTDAQISQIIIALKNRPSVD